MASLGVIPVIFEGLTNHSNATTPYLLIPSTHQGSELSGETEWMGRQSVAYFLNHHIVAHILSGSKDDHLCAKFKLSIGASWRPGDRCPMVTSYIEPDQDVAVDYSLLAPFTEHMDQYLHFKTSLQAIQDPNVAWVPFGVSFDPARFVQGSNVWESFFTTNLQSSIVNLGTRVLEQNELSIADRWRHSNTFETTVSRFYGYIFN